MPDQHSLYSLVPSNKLYGRFSGKYVLPFLFQEPEITFIIEKDKNFFEKIAPIISAAAGLKATIFCPVCHRAEVTHFILPNLNNFSPCFRQTCCQSQKCKQKLLETYVTKETDLLPFGIQTMFLFKDERERKLIMKFYREIFKIPTDLTGIEFIHWFEGTSAPFQEVFSPVEIYEEEGALV